MAAPKFPLRELLSKKETALGAWQVIPSTLVSRLLAGSSPDLSWILVDAEHGLINDTHLYDLANAIASQGLSPIVRVPIDQDWWIKRALDSGAHGVMVPMAHNADVVKKIVSYSKYPPTGIRGYGPLFTHAAGATGAKYAATADKNMLVVVQIESREGLNNIDEICAVDGLDVAFIGPYDLAMSMGVQPHSDEHQAAITKILEACKKAGKTAAIFCSTGEEAKRRKEQGFDMISIGVDMDAINDQFKAWTDTTLGRSVSTKTAGLGGYGGN